MWLHRLENWYMLEGGNSETICLQHMGPESGIWRMQLSATPYNEEAAMEGDFIEHAQRSKRQWDAKPKQERYTASM
ncbi:hypothetical protein N7489_005776 [Penicillium chrysogenum]|uniref:uncharacterized protein n=1 Tax=Penicillium chrysogenum TaxID=5076 RepID=UPI0024DF2980|nr:uncharacterized protein N7489_005776 [Penicillium chrysogenum]KAJ5245680.1 hypothetical protein N7489_005776 [Penicillium chrysogenum]